MDQLREHRAAILAAVSGATAGLVIGGVITRQLFGGKTNKCSVERRFMLLYMLVTECLQCVILGRYSRKGSRGNTRMPPRVSGVHTTRRPLGASGLEVTTLGGSQTS